MKLTTEECRCKSFRSREELSWNVCLGRLHTTIVHCGGLIKRIADFESTSWLQNLLGCRWEGAWLDLCFFGLAHIALHPRVYLRINLSFLAHFPQHLMLVGPLRVLQCQVTVAKLSILGHFGWVTSHSCFPLRAIASVVCAEKCLLALGCLCNIHHLA